MTSEEQAAAWSLILGERIDFVYDGCLVREVDDLGEHQEMLTSEQKDANRRLLRDWWSRKTA